MRGNAFWRYMRHHAKSTLLRCVVLAALCVILTMTLFHTSVYELADGSLVIMLNSGVLNFILGALATVLPVLELDGFKSKRNLDTLLALPISRARMAAVHYLNGIWQLLLCFAVVLPIALSRLMEHADILHIGYFFPQCALSVLGALIVYSVFSFVFMQAETTADGVMVMLLYIALPNVILMATDRVVPIVNEVMETALLYWPVSFSRWVYGGTVCYGTAPVWETVKVVALLVWLAAGAAALLGYFYTFPRHRAEGVGGLSDTPFGYRMLIPVYGYALLLADSLESPLFWALIAVMMTVGYMLYRRGPRLRRGDIYALIGTVPVYILSILL